METKTRKLPTKEEVLEILKEVSERKRKWQAEVCQRFEEEALVYADRVAEPYEKYKKA